MVNIAHKGREDLLGRNSMANLRFYLFLTHYLSLSLLRPLESLGSPVCRNSLFTQVLLYTRKTQVLPNLYSIINVKYDNNLI